MIRQLTLSDLDYVQALHDQSLKSNWTQTLYKQELLDFNTIGYVLIENNHFVGFVLGKMLVDSSDLYQIVVSDIYKGKGYGFKLLDAYWNEVLNRGGKESILEVNSRHADVVAFYTRFGYRTLYTRRHYYGRNRDALIMKKEVTYVNTSD